MAEKSANTAQVFKSAGLAWVADDCMRWSAALAYYSMISLAPLLVVTLKVTTIFLSPERARKGVGDQLSGLMGADAAKAAGEILANTKNASSGTLATIVSLVILIMGATGVFGELQSAMNMLFKVKAKPHSGVLDWLRHRFLSVSMIFGIGFLLLVSLFISTALHAIVKGFGPAAGALAVVSEIAVSFLVLTLLFAGIFRFLPDVHVNWKPVLFGATITATLFIVGKWLLSWYLSRGSTTSAYGAAGSLAALLIWIYYSAQILYFGGELTYAYADVKDEKIVPDGRAVSSTPPPPSSPPPAPPRVHFVKETIWTKALASGAAGFAAGIGATEAYRRARYGREVFVAQKRIEAVEKRVRQIDQFELNAKRLEVEEQFRKLERRLESAATSRTKSFKR